MEDRKRNLSNKDIKGKPKSDIVPWFSTMAQTTQEYDGVPLKNYNAVVEEREFVEENQK